MRCALEMALRRRSKRLEAKRERLRPSPHCDSDTSDSDWESRSGFESDDEGEEGPSPEATLWPQSKTNNFIKV